MFVAILALLLAKVLVSFMVQNKKNKNWYEAKVKILPGLEPSVLKRKKLGFSNE